MNLDERIERLENQNRWLKRLGILAIMLAGVGISLGFQNAQDQLKAQQAKLRLGILNQITVGRDTGEVMKQLIQSAKNGDQQATRTMLGIIFSDIDDD